MIGAAFALDLDGDVVDSPAIAQHQAHLGENGVGVGNGIDARVDGDMLSVAGSRQPKGGGTVVTHMDHRIAMSFLVLGLAARSPVRVDDGSPIATSFPVFEPLMARLGAKIGREE